MRYKVFYGTGSTTYAVCYGATEGEAKQHFGEYNPNTVIMRVEEFQMLQNLIQTCST